MFAQEMPPAAQPADIQVLHQARAVYDCANLQITDYLSGDRGSWAIAELVPAKTSGYSTVPGAVIRDGRVESSANSPLSVMKVGHWRLLTSSTSGPVAAGDYSWIEPIEERRRPTPEDVYSPFVNGGVILYQPQTDPAKPFTSVRVVFRDWTAAWPQALKAVASSPKTDTQLTTVSDQSNPWLEIQEFRSVLRRKGNSADAGDLWSIVMNKSGTSAAVMTYLMLVESTSPVPVDALLRPASADRLHGIVLGAFAARTFAHSARISAATDEFLTKVRQHLGSSPALESIYKISGLTR